ncbi:Na+/H+ antiporter NhaD [Methylomagnum ishizawai]|uniref:Na+/H+ antiporter NhaD n=1 Tax=Methylomagnum ishizawai TaxID=1760988 RepID=A0A1Y6D4Y4_9GAMM|nr:sodium:proton antiporter NhaD [Methylomagnum ishizawai]SMF95923.1 Na+/H+ antiporter NhaD [Methylomagnum ishizawai]
MAKRALALCSLLSIPLIAVSGEIQEPPPVLPHLDLTHHFIGYLAIAITVLAYILAMTEETTDLRKSKPMVMGAALVWFAICIQYALVGDPKPAVTAFESNLLAYAELLLFILVSMTYLNAMEDRGIFDALRVWLLNREFSYRQLFWITGGLAFVISTAVSGLAVGLLMGAVAAAVGKHEPKFVALACVNIVVATNAGGSFCPLGGISTLFVWQSGIVEFAEFFRLAVPCLVNFLVPALIMHFFVPRECPVVSRRQVVLRRGARRIIALFVLTLAITVASDVFLKLPPAAGMMAGLGLLQFFSFYLLRTAHEPDGSERLGDPKAVNWLDDREYDIFQKIGNLEWDTLLFFYGAMMLIGALGFIGYLDAIAQFLFGQISPTLANILIGLSSAFVDNGTLMFAVLAMHPDISEGQWLLLTLTLGVGGSLLAIGSAPGVGLLGQLKGVYTFGFHLRWFPVILLGYFASVAAHFWVNARYF